MFVGLESCSDSEKVRQIWNYGMQFLKKYYTFTREDKEELLMNAFRYFELNAKAGKDFPLKWYITLLNRHASGLLLWKNAQKRRASKKVGNARVYYSDVSLYQPSQEDDTLLLIDMIPDYDENLRMVELFTLVEQEAPMLLPLLKKALDGETLNKKERQLLRSVITKQDLLQ